MPAYDFECVQCGKVFETSLSISEKAAGKAACPACGSRSLTRLYTGVPTIKSKQAQCCGSPEGCGNSSRCENAGCCPMR